MIPILWSTDVWIVHFVHPIDRLGYPTLIVSFGVALILLSWQPDKYYTLATFLAIGAFTLHMGAFLQNFLYGHEVMLLTASASSLQWFPFVYVLLFLFLERRYARIFSVFFYLSFTIPLCVYSVADWQTIHQRELFPMYVQIVCCHPMYISALTYIEIVQRALAEARVQLGTAETTAMSDYLTGLLNRRAATTVLQETIDHDRQHDKTTTVMIIDIDYFKQVNDTFGHDVGDTVLVEFAALLQEHVREADILGRWGGEEFMLVLPSTGSEQAQTLAERLCSVVSTHSFPGVGQVTTSIGVAISETDETLERIVKRADIALYTAKQSGRNRALLSAECAEC